MQIISGKDVIVLYILFKDSPRHDTASVAEELRRPITRTQL